MTDFGDQAILTIDLDALVANWRRLGGMAPKAECAAVVKADAYGLGAAKVGPALFAAGCRRFFVAHSTEALALREAVPEATIHVLHGPAAGAEADLAAANLSPVLSTPGQIAAWAAEARRLGRKLPAAIHIDTGMNRLGLNEAEANVLVQDPSALDGLDVQFVMTHLACSDEPDHPLNQAQRERFAAWRQRFPALKGSLANSAGIFLGADYHHDILRPGIALYGSNPLDPAAGPRREASRMAEVVHLQGRILQVRSVDRGDTVGYGAGYIVEKPSRIATVAVGYADGFSRALSGRGSAVIRGRQGHVRVPIAGRVSMDLITLDVSALGADDCLPGMSVSLLGGGIDIDEQAACAGTIGYELLTQLGKRYRRVYKSAA
ncbi:alanine racemase [Ferrovibrio sp.]|uniref:alanine racemase n=1 Tax=Ferrovibrio sp. TaxID=1917215 RepID=UPI002635D139|nr:alanine racemase [Ferrovibrio sp.]